MIECRQLSGTMIVSIEGSAASVDLDPSFRDIIGVQLVWKRTMLPLALIDQLLRLGLWTLEENVRDVMILRCVTIARVHWMINQ